MREYLKSACNTISNAQLAHSNYCACPLSPDFCIRRSISAESHAVMNFRELRELLYELEAYLAKQPHSPEARLLKDQMQVAMRRSEDMEHPSSATMEYKRTSPFVWLVGLAII